MHARWKIIGLAVAVLALILIFFTRSDNDQPTASQQTLSRLSTQETPPAPQPKFQIPTEPGAVTNGRDQNPAVAQNNNVTPGKELLQDPVAREALALVGSDPEADQYWLDAIFDTSLSDNEREDLMEDLNETGFDDPKNLTTDDLPLILSRLEIIYAVLPDADDFMTEHLLEAQKDLVNMFAQATGQQ